MDTPARPYEYRLIVGPDTPPPPWTHLEDPEFEEKEKRVQSLAEKWDCEYGTVLRLLGQFWAGQDVEQVLHKNMNLYKLAALKKLANRVPNIQQADALLRVQVQERTKCDNRAGKLAGLRLSDINQVIKVIDSMRVQYTLPVPVSGGGLAKKRARNVIKSLVK